MDFKGKNVVVTGAAGGIGFETCKQLLLQGVERIGIFEICETSERIEALKKEFNTKTILCIKTDVTNKQDVDKAFKIIVDNFKTIDIIIANAGIFNDKDMHTTMDINFFGVVNTTLKAMEIMSVENGGKGGIIASVASVAGIVPFCTSPIYVASKHAVVGFIRSLSDEYYHKRHGIDFILICPGVTDTNLIADADKRLLFSEMGYIWLEILKTLAMNKVTDMGKFITDILKVGKNGSVWIADNGKIWEADIPNYWP